MIRELVVISGKGGTGKTSIAAALAALGEPLVLADCDVDAPDLDLLVRPRVRERELFSGGKKARIEGERCWACGACADVCRFDAIREVEGGDGAGPTYAVDPMACEGCGACVGMCPEEAILFEPVINGVWLVSETRFGPMVHARLDPGEENSGKLVSTVRSQARSVAGRRGLPLVVVDGAPGIGCPVIASLTNADLALVVAEPTLSGVHDARRVLDLAGNMGVAAALCVNRWDLDPGLADLLEEEARVRGVPVLPRVREDPAFVDAQLQATTLIEYGRDGAASDLGALWDRLRVLL